MMLPDRDRAAGSAPRGVASDGPTSAGRRLTWEGTMVLPHDIVDLQLAPVALALDQELEVLGRLDGQALLNHILLATNRRVEDATDQGEREAMVVSVLTQFIDLHGWQVTCDPRGVRLTHHEHRIVLGVPDSVREFVEAVTI